MFLLASACFCLFQLFLLASVQGFSGFRKNPEGFCSFVIHGEFGAVVDDTVRTFGAELTEDCVDAFTEVDVLRFVNDLRCQSRSLVELDDGDDIRCQVVEIVGGRVGDSVSDDLSGSFEFIGLHLSAASAFRADGSWRIVVFAARLTVTADEIVSALLFSPESCYCHNFPSLLSSLGRENVNRAGRAGTADVVGHGT